MAEARPTKTRQAETGTKQQVVAWLDKDLVRAIDHLAVDWEMYRQDAIEKLLRQAMEASHQPNSGEPPWEAGLRRQRQDSERRHRLLKTEMVERRTSSESADG